MGKISVETQMMKGLLCEKLKEQHFIQKENIGKRSNRASCSKKRRKPSWLEQVEQEGGLQENEDERQPGEVRLVSCGKESGSYFRRN